MTSETILDSSMWIAIFNDERIIGDYAEAQQRLVTTPVVLAEVAAKWRLGKVRGSDPVADVEARSRLEPLTRDDALEAAETYVRLRSGKRRKVSLSDALIHATARRIGADLITFDANLRGEPGVVVLGKRP